VPARRILITGSTGNLGAKAVACLAREPDVDIVQMGRNSGGDPGVITARLETYDAAWARHFDGVDAVLHLAADSREAGDWTSVCPLNIDLALNVFRAAEENRVRRLVFASSNWVLGGYRFRSDRLNATLPPLPVNPYGASKLFIERYGLSVAKRTGMAFLALRIGYCQPGENHPGPHMTFGRWGQQMWLGNQDWEQAVVKSTIAPFEGAAIINIVSRNDGMRWDLGEARAAIGYEPVETHKPVLGSSGYMKELAARLRESLSSQGAPTAPFGARW
jgi:NAD+ dependent glucose-6-phosphate dehydrogenase